MFCDKLVIPCNHSLLKASIDIDSYLSTIIQNVWKTRNKQDKRNKHCFFKGTVHPREKLYYWTYLCKNLIQGVKGRKIVFIFDTFLIGLIVFFFFEILDKFFEMFPFRKFWGRAMLFSLFYFFIST